MLHDKINSTCQIYFIDMQSNQYTEFKYIMVYQDINTHKHNVFVHNQNVTEMKVSIFWECKRKV